MTDIAIKSIEVDEILNLIEKRDPGQEEFKQAVKEVMESVVPFIKNHKKYENSGLLQRLIEPERAVIFRVPWLDDQGSTRVNRGFRVQFNSALGPYKGGLRFHPSVNLSVVKFLAFEQIFKNSLTGLPLGGGKGGSDFNPRGKSDGEIMRFCQSFMNELYRFISSDKDVPAGDIGVGEREIGYLFGQYKRLTSEFEGAITGKGIAYGGSKMRTQATGYGLLYFVDEVMKSRSESVEGKSIVISGSGNVAQYACEKAVQLGGKVVCMSDSDGYIYDESGIDEEKLEFIKELKNVQRGRIKEYAEKYNVPFSEGTPWEIPCDIALPCATQNEIDQNSAEAIVDNGVICLAEGANMPCTDGALEILQNSNVLYAPGKATNAGGVAVSGLEMSQNSKGISLEAEEVDRKLREIMKTIHDKCTEYGETDNGTDYLKGANIAAFIKVADAMLAQGAV